MRRILCAAAIVAVCFVTPVRADDATTCPTLDQSRARFLAVAEQKGIGMVNLDGDKAQKFLDYVGSHGVAGLPKADHLAIFLSPSMSSSLVALSDGPCGGLHSYFVIPVDLEKAAYEAATA